MTNGIVSIRKGDVMLFKIVVGQLGMNAAKVASRVRALNHTPDSGRTDGDLCGRRFWLQRMYDYS